MIIRNPKQLTTYQEAAKVSTEILRKLYDKVAAGVAPIEIDELAFKLCKSYGVEPSFLGVAGLVDEYKFATCICVNDVAVHGIPSPEPLKPGDLVSVDFGIIYEGFYTDHCFTVGIDPVAQLQLDLLKYGRDAVWKGVQTCVVGNRIGDIGYEIQQVLQPRGFTTLRSFTGHSLGRSLHDEPMVPSYGKKGKGSKLKDGMVLCIEAQVVPGSWDYKTDSDGWTVRTADGEPVVMFEYMAVVGKGEPLVLTDTYAWELVVGR
jgi:methionyl aminopeptidase